MEIIKKNKLYKILSVTIVSFMFIFLCYYSYSKSFWLDELDWTIDYLAKSNNLIELISSLVKAGFNLPLFYVLLFPIYKIVPYGELWLLLPNYIIVIWGIYVITRLGNIIGNKIGKDLGFASLCISATSFTLIEYCAFEFRPYALLFALSTYALYRFICRLQEPQKQRNIILYTLSIICLAFTHWFGCLIIAFYFLFDLFLWLRKKHKISFVIPYISLGIVFLPYFIIMILNHTTDFSNYWADIPTIKNLFTEPIFLLSNNKLCILLFIVGSINLLYNLFKKDISNNIDKKIILLLFGSVAWIFGTIFLYSRFINPNGSLWVSRYFTVLLPHMFIITAIPIGKLLNSLSSTSQKKYNLLSKNCLVVCIVIFIIGNIAFSSYKKSHNSRNSIYEPYREASNIIATTPDLYKDDCALLTSCGTGYLTYYFEKKGVKLPNTVYIGSSAKISKYVSKGKVIESTHVNIEDLLKYDKLYLFCVHDKFEEELLTYINNYYDSYTVNQTFGLNLYVKK